MTIFSTVSSITKDINFESNTPPKHWLDDPISLISLFNGYTRDIESKILDKPRIYRFLGGAQKLSNFRRHVHSPNLTNLLSS